MKNRTSCPPATVTVFFAGATSAMAHHLPPGYEDVDEFGPAQMASSLLHQFTSLDHLLPNLAMGLIVYVVVRRLSAALLARPQAQRSRSREDV